MQPFGNRLTSVPTNRECRSILTKLSRQMINDFTSVKNLYYSGQLTFKSCCSQPVIKRLIFTLCAIILIFFYLLPKLFYYLIYFISIIYYSSLFNGSPFSSSSSISDFKSTLNEYSFNSYNQLKNYKINEKDKLGLHKFLSSKNSKNSKSEDSESLNYSYNNIPNFFKHEITAHQKSFFQEYKDSFDNNDFLYYSNFINYYSDKTVPPIFGNGLILGRFDNLDGRGENGRQAKFSVEIQAKSSQTEDENSNIIPNLPVLPENSETILKSSENSQNLHKFDQLVENSQQDSQNPIPNLPEPDTQTRNRRNKRDAIPDISNSENSNSDSADNTHIQTNSNLSNHPNPLNYKPNGNFTNFLLINTTSQLSSTTPYIIPLRLSLSYRLTYSSEVHENEKIEQDNSLELKPSLDMLKLNLKSGEASFLRLHPDAGLLIKSTTYAHRSNLNLMSQTITFSRNNLDSTQKLVLNQPEKLHHWVENTILHNTENFITDKEINTIQSIKFDYTKEHDNFKIFSAVVSRENIGAIGLVVIQEKAPAVILLNRQETQNSINIRTLIYNTKFYSFTNKNVKDIVDVKQGDILANIEKDVAAEVALLREKCIEEANTKYQFGKNEYDVDGLLVSHRLAWANLHHMTIELRHHHRELLMLSKDMVAYKNSKSSMYKRIQHHFHSLNEHYDQSYWARVGIYMFSLDFR